MRLSRLLTGEVANLRNQLGQISLDMSKAWADLKGALVHIESAIDFQLQCMAPHLWPAITADDLDALIRVVPDD